MVDLRREIPEDLQRAYKFKLFVSLNSSAGSLTLPTILVESVTLPTFDVSPFEFPAGAGDIKIQDFRKLGNVTIDLVEDSDGNVNNILQIWRDNVISPNGVFGYPEEYKGIGELQVLRSNNELVYTWKLEGMWPTQMNPVKFGYNEEGLLVLSQEFSVDAVSIV